MSEFEEKIKEIENRLRKLELMKEELISRNFYVDAKLEKEIELLKEVVELLKK